MAQRRARSKMPLEWKADQLTAVTDDTNVNTAIDLDLLPDEVAEIHKIESKIVPYPTVAAAGTPTQDQALSVSIALSMDPNFAGEPRLLSAANELEDLEVFYDQQYEGKFDTEGTEANFQFYKLSEFKVVDYDPPILVGTNVGFSMTMSNTPDEFDAKALVRLYFTRRRASVTELNQILLKRR